MRNMPIPASSPSNLVFIATPPNTPPLSRQGQSIAELASVLALPASAFAFGALVPAWLHWFQALVSSARPRPIVGAGLAGPDLCERWSSRLVATQKGASLAADLQEHRAYLQAFRTSLSRSSRDNRGAPPYVDPGEAGPMAETLAGMH
jgi:hypothetical protein